MLIRAITEQNRFIESTKKQKSNEENNLNAVEGNGEGSYNWLQNDRNSSRSSSGSIGNDKNNKKLGKSDHKEDNAVQMPISNTKKSFQITTTEYNIEGKLLRQFYDLAVSLLVQTLPEIQWILNNDIKQN